MSVELIDTAQLTWANALDELPKRSVSGIVDVAPLDGRILLTAELALLLGLIERLLGGQGLDRPTERSLTDVDRALTKRIFATLLDELSISFNDVAELSFGLVDIETERAPAQLAPLSEPTLAMTFEVKLGRASSTMVLLIPHRAIEPRAACPRSHRGRRRGHRRHGRRRQRRARRGRRAAARRGRLGRHVARARAQRCAPATSCAWTARPRRAP